VYRIAFTVSDGNGGSCSGEVKVSVPKDKNHKAQENDHVSVDSFGKDH
jgi:hypothetical protein